jgi:phosphopantothenate---cysteine ligase (ATP)
MTDDSLSFLSELPSGERETLKFELKTFGVTHASHHRPIAIITSGGTAADLEVNSVRCLDNFSTGQRGAISVEEFLKRGYAVIHLWRTGSASPFGRRLSELLGSKPNNAISCASLGKLFVGDNEDDNEDRLVQSVLEAEHDPWLTDPSTANASSSQPSLKRNRKSPNDIILHRRIVNSSTLQASLKERNSALKEGRLLTVPFRSVEEYIGKLQLCAESVRHSQALAIIYLAAAVSDFYIPRKERSEHKIQSSDGAMTLKLSPVPKVLGKLRSEWAPDAFVCSFKLETDREILRTKAERAVEKYGCHMVIGNLLHTRHEQVCVLAPEHQDMAPSDVKDWPMQEINKPKSSSDPDVLESMIVDFVIQAHFEYISTSCSGSFDKSGTEAVLRAHEKLEKEREKLRRELFWQKAQSVALEWAGAFAGVFLSFVISSAIRRKMEK